MSGASRTLACMERPKTILQRLETSPMVVAVEWDEYGRTWAGRVANWYLTPDGWVCHVLGEAESCKAGAGGGWMAVADVRPSQHEVFTTHSLWSSWTPPVWPPELEHFAGAAWNHLEHERAERNRPESLGGQPDGPG